MVIMACIMFATCIFPLFGIVFSRAHAFPFLLWDVLFGLYPFASARKTTNSDPFFLWPWTLDNLRHGIGYGVISMVCGYIYGFPKGYLPLHHPSTSH